MGELLEAVIETLRKHGIEHVQAANAAASIVGLFEYSDTVLDDDPDSETCGEYLHVFTFYSE